jgi:hypothetical protein
MLLHASPIEQSGMESRTGGVDCCAFPRLLLKPLGAAPNHGTVLLIEAVVPRLIGARRSAVAKTRSGSNWRCSGPPDRS